MLFRSKFSEIARICLAIFVLAAIFCCGETVLYAAIGEEKEELGIATISNHLKWDEKRLKKVIKNLIKEEFVYIDNDEHMYLLTEKGDTKFLNIKKFYNF